ncbi:Hypothetical protein SMAX5B_009558 [Scophthalmus maximus]|uniref:Uncharacterized protein n=1 Tax=Scophthalmus maximus TaxID=52904 RepID=A0A2U9AZE7_SCOMX|nr:Hypothetical protein SMAX5B_009558 [Scophthalmus maximus]
MRGQLHFPPAPTDIIQNGLAEISLTPRMTYLSADGSRHGEGEAQADRGCLRKGTRGTSSVNKCDACWLRRRVAAWWK